VRADAVLAALRPGTKLVALMAANNETGVLQPVAELAPRLRERGVAFHVDAAQAVGRVDFDAAALGATTVAVSGHKIGGPAGIGALRVEKGRRLVPFVRGGRQERGLRGGTHNLLGAIGFGAAARAALAAAPRAGEVAAARDELERALRRLRPGARVLGAAVPRLPNTTAVTIPGVDAARLLRELSRRGVHASSGSACQAGVAEPSHVLRAMGLPAAEARATLRFSFGREATPADAIRASDRVAAALSTGGPAAD
jgi:cysteine desulfurase